MKITGRNSAIGQSAVDVWTKSGSFAEPTAARIHTLVSNSAEDDYSGELQIETATAVGTIAGVLQVETATVAGTIGPAGVGNAKVTITSALLAEALEVSVAVANDDTANNVATKIRAALNQETDITDNFTVGGTNAEVKLTTKAYASNDTTLNIAIDNDTCSGLTAAPTSTDTTAGKAGSGNLSVTVTTALLQSPEVVSVAVVRGDTASQWAEKVRAALTANENISEYFTVGGTTTAISLTTKSKAANDTTLNIAIAAGTANGITPVVSSADTHTGYLGTGAQVVEVIGIDASYRERKLTVYLNGTTGVAMTVALLHINSMRVIKAGSGGKNAGLITATAATNSTITAQIEVGKNITQQAIFMAHKTMKITNFFSEVYNATSGAITTVELQTKGLGEVWTPITYFCLHSNKLTFEDTEGNFMPALNAGTFFKVNAVASAGTSDLIVLFDVN